MPLPDLSPELHFQTARSGGPGGQHVNKVETKVEVRFNPAASALLDDRQKARLQKKLAHQLSTDGTLLITAQEHRSQKQNKELAVKKLIETLEKALIVPKRRITTLPTVASVRERLEAKQAASEKKQTRRKPDQRADE